MEHEVVNSLRQMSSRGDRDYPTTRKKFYPWMYLWLATTSSSNGTGQNGNIDVFSLQKVGIGHIDYGTIHLYLLRLRSSFIRICQTGQQQQQMKEHFFVSFFIFIFLYRLAFARCHLLGGASVRTEFWIQNDFVQVASIHMHISNMQIHKSDDFENRIAIELCKTSFICIMEDSW